LKTFAIFQTGGAIKKQKLLHWNRKHDQPGRSISLPINHVDWSGQGSTIYWLKSI